MLRVVTIGGGGGHAQVLMALKGVSGLEITAVCPSTDSGGSTGILKEEYGAKGYLGDLTRCAAALCQNELLSRVLMYRYEDGSLKGHSIKNLLLLSLEKKGGHKEGLKLFWKLCGLNGHRVLPVTVKKTQLCATLNLGNQVVNEANIDTLAKNPLWHPDVHAIKKVFLKPEVSITKDVREAVAKADWLVISPGDFYSSIVPVLLPVGMKEVIRNSKAKIVLILNIVNKRGETDHYTVDDFLTQIEEYMGKPADVVYCNDKEIPKKIALKYELEDKIALLPKGAKRESDIRSAPFATVNNDGSLVHDLDVLRKEFKKIFS